MLIQSFAKKTKKYVDYSGTKEELWDVERELKNKHHERREYLREKSEDKDVLVFK